MGLLHNEANSLKNTHLKYTYILSKSPFDSRCRARLLRIGILIIIIRLKWKSILFKYSKRTRILLSLPQHCLLAKLTTGWIIFRFVTGLHALSLFTTKPTIKITQTWEQTTDAKKKTQNSTLRHLARIVFHTKTTTTKPRHIGRSPQRLPNPKSTIAYRY